jgi:hypothetical protein
MDLTAELGKLAGDEVGCAMLLEAKLGVGLQSRRQAVISP